MRRLLGADYDNTKMFVFHFTAVPGPVRGLAVSFLSEEATYNSSSRTFSIAANISWQLPQFPNGEIVAYSYRLVETGGVVVIENMNTTALSVVQNTTVSPFTNYTATVVAYTSAGSGDSVMQVVLSPEAGIVTIWISWHMGTGGH